MSDHSDTDQSPLRDLEHLLENPPAPRHNTEAPFTVFLFAYVIAVARAIIRWCAHLFHQITDSIDAIESRIDLLDSSKADPTSAAEQTPRTPFATKCAKCHARGHLAKDCKTDNPAAVRRRIAANAKARSMRRLQSQLPSSFLVSQPPPLIASSPSYIHAPTQDVAFYVAESAELRRRMAQSARDKRRNKGKAKASST